MYQCIYKFVFVYEQSVQDMDGPYTDVFGEEIRSISCGPYTEGLYRRPTGMYLPLLSYICKLF